MTDTASRGFSVATWNMDHWRRTPADRARAWCRLRDYVRPTVALLQECAPIRGLAGQHLYRELGRSRPWGTAVVALEAGAELEEINHAVTPYSHQSLPVHGSVPGALAVARLTLPDVAPITVVSVYGLIDVYSQTSMLRHVADLIPLFDSADGERVILGGDFNVGTDTRGPHRERYTAILNAVRSLGLVDLYSAVADRPLPPSDCPCIDDTCVHLTTRDGGGTFDYLFASPPLATYCHRVVRHDDQATCALSDHFPVVAEFELPRARGKMIDLHLAEDGPTVPTPGFTALFDQRASGSLRPLENFTSTMVAFAINANPRPFVDALQTALDRAVAQGRDVSAAGTLGVRLAADTKARAETQVFLEARGGEAQRGYLDVVVTLDDGSRSQEVWIEAKVDAGLTMHQIPTLATESPSTEPDENVSEAEAVLVTAEAALTATAIHQVQVYLAHRSLERTGRPVEPLIVTLARTDRVVPEVPGITWQDIYDAAQTAARSDIVWTHATRFLREQGIAFERMEVTTAAVLPVFLAVNNLIKELWPSDRANSNMHTTGVSNWVNRSIEAGMPPMLTAQCLSYGARPLRDGVEWWIAVGDGSDFQKTHVPVERVIEAAPAWFRESWSFVDERRVDRIDVFEKRMATQATQDAIDFLTAALREVAEAGVIEPYLAERRIRPFPTKAES